MGKKAKILVVEDERIVAEDIEKNLMKLGYHVTALASSGDQAIKAARSNRPDLVLMDIVLQGRKTGIETAQELRSELDVPVVYLTAYADENTLSKAKITEPSGYLLKPFEKRELHSVIEMALYKHSTEHQLKKNEAWLTTILQSIADGVIVTDRKQMVTFMNDVAEMLTGWKQKDAVERHLDTIFQVQDEKTGKKVSFSRQSASRTAAIQKYKGSFVLNNRLGAEIPLEVNISPIYDEKSEIIGHVLIFHNISDRRKAEQESEFIQVQLHQAQKMEAIGLLAGGIAHDFNNLLTVIQGNNSLAMQKVHNEDPLFKDLNEIEIAADRAADLTRQLLLFSRKQPMKFVSLQLNQVVEDMRNMLRLLIGEKIMIEIDLASALWVVRGDKGTIEQVIMNICVNARDALTNGGRLTIDTQNIVLDKTTAKNHPSARPGHFVLLTIRDNGTGMDQNTMAQIFDPFFSTKGEGKGTGLGLSVVYGIVRQHHGWIDVNSDEGQGTTFDIYLPATLSKTRNVVKQKATLSTFNGNGKRVLVIEDDDGVRKFTQSALLENGYKVYEAADSAQAKNVFKRQKGRFDLIVSDVVLSQESGTELVELFRTRNPKIKCLLSSGYQGSKSQWNHIRKKGYPFIQKPYGLNELLQAVKKVFS